VTTLYVPGDSRLHQLAAQVKIVAAVVFMVIVVATPREAVAVFIGYGLVVVALMVMSGIRVAVLLRRMVIEIPFVIFALALPWVGHGPQVAVGPVLLSEPGLWAAWNILAKATIGTGTAVVLSATTSPADFVGGLARLRLPAAMVLIAGFMVRYTEVVVGEVTQMRTAMTARGFTARNVRHWPQVAHALAALFIRTYERGERIHVAMVARGYDGTARGWDSGVTATPAAWGMGLALPVIALTGLGLSVML